MHSLEHGNMTFSNENIFTLAAELDMQQWVNLLFAFIGRSYI